MEGGKKLIVAAVLIVVIVGALTWILRSQGVVGGGPRPPAHVLNQQVEMMDCETDEVITKTLGDWQYKYTAKDGYHKSPTSGKYTMVSPMECGNPACKKKIPSPVAPKEVTSVEDQANPDAAQQAIEKWQLQQKCKHCGKCPFQIYPDGQMPRPQ